MAAFDMNDPDAVVSPGTFLISARPDYERVQHPHRTGPRHQDRHRWCLLFRMNICSLSVFLLSLCSSFWSSSISVDVLCLCCHVAYFFVNLRFVCCVASVCGHVMPLHVFVLQLFVILLLFVAILCLSPAEPQRSLSRLTQ